MATIAELTYYPIKGCAGISAPTAVLTPAGLRHDRSFMVTDEAGTFRSQRRDPRLALIQPRIDPAGQRLTLRAPETEALSIDVDTTATPREVTLFGTPYRGIDQGDMIARWLSEVLGVPSRLVRVPPDHHRIVDGHTQGTSGYADSCAVHILTRASLQQLNKRLTQHGGQPLPISRFRPNIVIDGWDTPHTEDHIRDATIGTTELGYAKLAIRCAVTTVDQESGGKTGPEPLRTLARYRRTADGPAFGAKFAVLQTGTLDVGDEVIVNSWDRSGTAPARQHRVRNG